MSVEHLPTPGVPTVGGLSGLAISPIPTDYASLERLYEIQTVLARSIGIEQACDAFLPILSRALSIRTAVLLDLTHGLYRASTWAASGIGPVELQEANDQARKALACLAPAAIAPTHVVSRSDVLAGGVTEQRVVDRCFVTLPLSLIDGHVFGVFQLEGAAAFDLHDLRFIGAVANQLAVALDRHHIRLQLEIARSEVEQANLRLRDLQTISKAALERATLDESLPVVLHAIAAMFQADAAEVLLATADGKALRRRANVGLEGGDDSHAAVAAGRIAATGTAMVFDDLDDLVDAGGTFGTHGIRSLLGAPLRARNHVTGVLYVAARGRRGFSHDELQFMEIVADRIGTIIDNAALYEQALCAIRSRDAVMGLVSHDLRNPLNSIQLCMELFATDDPRLTRPVSIIKRSVDLMLRLISDLRDVGSIEAGHLSIKIRSEEAGALVRDAIEGVQAAAAGRSLHLEARLPARDLVLECDRVRVIQVFTNLLSNAIKFTPQGGSITISIAEVERGYARFSIEDTGCGVPEGDLPHVFDRYWQAEGTAHLGTGLGLAIAKGIVEAHDGTMSVESRVGHGTTFSFTLPLVRAGGRNESAALQRGPGCDRISAHDAVGDRTGPRVLVVDDEPNSLTALAQLLADDGFIVETAADGLEALPKVRAFAPDIMIVDVEMPGLNGLDLVRKVREDAAELPVILMSGHDEHAVATAQVDLRASYIGKPLEFDQLVSAIHRELEKER